MSVVDFLRNVEYLREFHDESLKRISEISKIDFYDKNSIIFTEDEKGRFIYVVRTGRIKIFKTSPSGKEFIIKLMESGDVFAESLLFEDTNYPAHAQCMQASSVIAIDKFKLESLIETNCILAKDFIKIMSRRLNFLSKKMENLTLDNSVGKVAFLILELSSSKTQVVKDIQRKDLAKMINISRENFERILTYLSKKGVIQLDKGKIRILNREGLKFLMYK